MRLTTSELIHDVRQALLFGLAETYEKERFRCAETSLDEIARRLSYPMPVPDVEESETLGWHVISGWRLLDSLRRVQAGEDDADMLFAELWANAEHERLNDE